MCASANCEWLKPVSLLFNLLLNIQSAMSPSSEAQGAVSWVIIIIIIIILSMPKWDMRPQRCPSRVLCPLPVVLLPPKLCQLSSIPLRWSFSRWYVAFPSFLFPREPRSLPFVHMTGIHPQGVTKPSLSSSLQDGAHWFLLSHLKESAIGNFVWPEHSHSMFQC